jgi:hypothetical protein
MKTPVPYKEHPWSPLKYDVENVNIKVESEDASLQIIEVKPATKKTHHKKSHKKSSTMVQIKDTDDILDGDDEDKEILKSIKYAEKQLNTTMKTPVAYKEHPWSPLKYDVENVNIKVESDEDAPRSEAKLQIIDVKPVALAKNGTVNATSLAAPLSLIHNGTNASL